jgi:hypothetical protein
MPDHYYSLLGMVKATKNKHGWTVEVSYKDEDIHSGPYKTTTKWHPVGDVTTVEELNSLVMTLVNEETKRET